MRKIIGYYNGGEWVGGVPEEVVDVGEEKERGGKKMKKGTYRFLNDFSYFSYFVNIINGLTRLKKHIYIYICIVSAHKQN